MIRASGLFAECNILPSTRCALSSSILTESFVVMYREISCPRTAIEFVHCSFDLGV